MNWLISLVTFFIIFGVLVIVHEGGHYLIARMNDIRVKEFTIGVGPQLVHKLKHGTVFSIRALPFGGACIFDGMPGLEDTDYDYSVPQDGTFDPETGQSFYNANVWSRIATVFAGPFFNFILAYVIALIVTAFASWDFPVVSGFTEDSAAVGSGLQEGDLIVEMNGSTIHMGQEARLISQFNDGDPIDLVVERDGERVALQITPAWNETDSRYYMGIYIGQGGQVDGAQILPYAWYTVSYHVKSTYWSLARLVTGKLSKDALSGPVGIVKMVDDTYEQVRPYGIPSVILTMLEFLLLLSVNLAVINLLPWPGLDGGRLILLFIEVIRGKPIPPEREGFVHFAGMIALVALMVFVLFNDITKFVR